MQSVDQKSVQCWLHVDISAFMVSDGKMRYGGKSAPADNLAATLLAKS